MSKQSPFAREEVMEAYLDSLLKEPETPEDVTARTAKLLEQASQQIAETTLLGVEEQDSAQHKEEAIAEKVTSIIETSTLNAVEDKKRNPVAQTESQESSLLDTEIK